MRNFTPDYPILKEMSRDRFQELYIRVRLARGEAIGPYAKAGVFPNILLILLILMQG
jgi:hypothetical protein